MYEKMMQDSIGRTSPFIRDKLRIAVTNQCNLKCHYCHNEGQGHHCVPRYLSTGFIDDLAAYCRRGSYRLKKINITGGEPLLHPQLNEIVQKLSLITDDLRLNTNSVLLTEDRVKELIDLGIAEFKFGVDSFWSETDCSEIKTENLERIRSIIRRIRAYGAAVVINMVVTPYNHHLIDDMIAICRSLDISHIKMIEQVSCEAFSCSDLCRQAYKEYQSAYENYRKECVRFVPDIDAGMDDMYMESGLKIRWCESFCRSRACATMYTIINAEGRVTLCQKSSDSCSIDFSSERSVAEIDADIRAAHSKICNVAGRRYLRDINGVLLPAESSDVRRWDWEKEAGSFWRTPEPVVYQLAKRWQKGSIVLDLGCGMGRNSFAFAEEGFQVLAVDNASYAIDYTGNKAVTGVTADNMDMSRLNIPNGAIDYVFAFNSLSHCDDYLLSLAIREMYRVLRPNGEIWLTLCSKSADGWNDPNATQIAEHTKLKRKMGPEYGVAHFYADLEDVLFLFRGFEVLDIRHVDHCYYEDRVQNSWHYEVLLRKRSHDEYRTNLCSHAE